MEAKVLSRNYFIYLPDFTVSRPWIL